MLDQYLTSISSGLPRVSEGGGSCQGRDGKLECVLEGDIYITILDCLEKNHFFSNLRSFETNV